MYWSRAQVQNQGLRLRRGRGQRGASRPGPKRRPGACSVVRPGDRPSRAFAQRRPRLIVAARPAVFSAERGIPVRKRTQPDRRAIINDPGRRSTVEKSTTPRHPLAEHAHSPQGRNRSWFRVGSHPPLHAPGDRNEGRSRILRSEACWNACSRRRAWMSSSGMRITLENPTRSPVEIPLRQSAQHHRACESAIRSLSWAEDGP